MATNPAAMTTNSAAAVASAAEAAKKGAGTVLLALAAGQFLMILDSSVMNVSIATVAEDVGTTVAGHPDGDHPLHAGDGQPRDRGRKARHDHRPQARLLPRSA